MLSFDFEVAPTLVGLDVLRKMIEQQHIFINSDGGSLKLTDNNIILEKLGAIEGKLASMPNSKAFISRLDELLMFKASGLRRVLASMGSEACHDVPSGGEPVKRNRLRPYHR